MSELLEETVGELLAAEARPEAGWDAAFWGRLDDLGLTGIGVPEDAGGAGGTLADAAVVVRACGYHGAGVPLADHAFLATWALTRAGLPVPGGPLTAVIAPGVEVAPDGTATGPLPAVPWARHATHVVALVPYRPTAAALGGGTAGAGRAATSSDRPSAPAASGGAAPPGQAVHPPGRTTAPGEVARPRGQDAVPGETAPPESRAAASGEGGGIRVVVVDPAHTRVLEGENLAGEPRDDVVLDRTPVDVRDVPGVGLADAAASGALGRAVAICGAARRVLDLTVRYAGEREQFGRPIGRFQAVQQELSGLAGAVEQADAMAGQAVALADGAPDVARAAAAAAKICAGRAARAAITTGHQVHGAIGFTQEHALHHFTRRLLAWRDEHGAEPVWTAALGETVAAGGADTLWHLLTIGGPHA